MKRALNLGGPPPSAYNPSLIMRENIRKTQTETLSRKYLANATEMSKVMKNRRD